MKSSPILSQRDSYRSVGQVAIVASLWHQNISQSLVDGALKALERHQIPKGDVNFFWVPGAYELPQAVYALAQTKKYIAIIPLGCLIQGETSHFEFIAQTVFNSLSQIGKETGVAVVNGVLTVDHLHQAQERAGGILGNKGEEAALAALELASFLEEVRNGKSNARA